MGKGSPGTPEANWLPTPGGISSRFNICPTWPDAKP